jgi:decaprenylphospho-beta-D-ribofuranose 2-oxidase
MEGDTTAISNWGNYPRIDAHLKSFKSAREIVNEINSGASYIARGNGRCYGDSSLNTRIISTLKYDNILEFDRANATITCQSGVTFESLIQFLVPKGLFLPVTPGTKFITVGGAVASDIHGKNHHVDGSFGNHIIKMELLLSSGKIVECGHDLERELFEVTCGGMGLTGIILTVKFRLKKIDSAFIRQTSIKAKNLDEIFVLFEEYRENTYSVAWIDCLQKGNSLGRSLLMVGEHATEKDSSPLPKEDSRATNKKLNIPFNFPAWALNKYSIKIFNFLFYYKQFKIKKESIVNFDQFFYPLDFINNWNRMYGKKGFVQYQFVLPLENSKMGLRKILTEISNNGTGSFLAVLKLFGEQEGGLISFPMKGYTLALDFPVRKGLFEFLNQLDKLVLEYGGRIYLTKDARMDKKIFWKSYPEISRFQQIVKKFNPNVKWRSAQSDRLEILEP